MVIALFITDIGFIRVKFHNILSYYLLYNIMILLDFSLFMRSKYHQRQTVIIYNYSFTFLYIIIN